MVRYTKVTELPAYTDPITGDDLLTLVTDRPASSVRFSSWKVSVKNFLSQLSISLPQVTATAFKSVGSIVGPAPGAVFTGGEVGLTSNSSVTGQSQERYGLIVRNEILGAAQVTGTTAGMVVHLDTGPATTVSANTFGMLIDHRVANPANPRATAPQAFLGIRENAGTGGAQTLYLMDIGATGNAVSADLTSVGGNTATIISRCNASMRTALTSGTTYLLKIRVNGIDYWLHATPAS